VQEVAAGTTTTRLMSKNIVLIDRDKMRRGELRNALSEQGFSVAEFEAGRDAPQHILFNSMNAVLLDYGISYEPENPVPGGKQIVQEIVNIDAFVPLVLLCDRCETLHHETTAATDLILRRPLTDRQVVESLQTVLKETLRERAQRKSGYIFAFR
jgi:DNA-binding response OmpR family regulator